MYNIKDSNDDIKGGTIKFGLNQGALMTKIEHVKYDSGSECINVTLDVGGKTSFGSFWKPETLKDDGTPNTPGIEAISATLKHVLKAYGTDEEINTIFSSDIPDFKTLADMVCNFITPRMSKPVDVFLENKKPAKNSTDSYKGLPNSIIYGGKFICPATTQSWTEEREWNNGTVKGLRYVSGEEVHPFVRGEKYMKSEAAVGYGNGTNLTSGSTTKEQPPVKPNPVQW